MCCEIYPADQKMTTPIVKWRQKQTEIHLLSEKHRTNAEQEMCVTKQCISDQKVAYDNTRYCDNI